MIPKNIIINDLPDEDESIDFSRFIEDGGEIDNELNDFVDGNVAQGFTLGISCFDEYYVAKKFEFYGIVGKKGRGKTTINQAIQVAHSVANDLIWVVAFQENSSWSMKLNYMNYLLCDFAKDVKKNDPDLYKRAMDWLDKHFIFLKIESGW